MGVGQNKLKDIKTLLYHAFFVVCSHGASHVALACDHIGIGLAKSRVFCASTRSFVWM